MGDSRAAQLSPLRTAFCDLLGLRYPICQAGMGWVARSELAAAVSEAGGLGRTDRPFGVDILFATTRTTGDETDRFATPEAFGHANYKDTIVAIDEEGTVVTRAASGKPCRVIRNGFTREWETRQDEIQPFPVQFERVGKALAVRAREQGDIEPGSAACGQSAGLIHEVRPVRDVIARLVEEAEAALARRPRGA